MKNYKFLLSGFILLSISLFLLSTPALAATGGIGESGDKVELNNPLGDIDSPSEFIGTIIKAVLGIIGSLALLMFIYGGLTWMLAAGNTDKVTKGKNILIWAVIGLVVIFTAYAVVNFVFDSLSGTG